MALDHCRPRRYVFTVETRSSKAEARPLVPSVSNPFCFKLPFQASGPVVVGQSVANCAILIETAPSRGRTFARNEPRHDTESEPCPKAIKASWTRFWWCCWSSWRWTEVGAHHCSPTCFTVHALTGQQREESKLRGGGAAEQAPRAAAVVVVVYNWDLARSRRLTKHCPTKRSFQGPFERGMLAFSGRRRFR